MAAEAIVLLFGLVLAALPAMAEDLPPGIELVDVPGGRYIVGDPSGEPDEMVRKVELRPFRMMRREVTNEQFAAFVRASSHVTAPEDRGFGYVWPGRWQRQRDADWRHPSGPGSGIDGMGSHPVVQVAQRDAAAFCSFYGWRLPTDAEWEAAARGKGDRRTYPWGDEPPEERGRRRANFGTVECCAPDAADGWSRTAPVGSFPAGRSPTGLDDMAGNVWEWVTTPYNREPGWVALRGGGWGNNPYCLRVSYRHGNPPDIGLDMVGFRCAADRG
jgi:sulfatase modifying factor 1